MVQILYFQQLRQQVAAAAHTQIIMVRQVVRVVVLKANRQRVARVQVGKVMLEVVFLLLQAQEQT
jgi:hypothetical protein